MAAMLGSFDRQRELVIDPTLVYSTYLGGTGYDVAQGIAVDSAGDAFVVGQTSSTNFPTTSPEQSQTGGTQDAFVTKLNAGGSPVYSTYLGGSGEEWAYAVAVDSAGEAFVTGFTESTNFPTAAPFQGAYGGSPEDVFVTKLSASGSALLYSTYLGTGGNNQGRGIVVDSAGEAFVTGEATGSIPTASPLQGTPRGYGDAFVTKFNAAGSALVYSTYLGGSSPSGDAAFGVSVDPAGDAFVVGQTLSTTFPTASPYQSTNGGGSDAFVTELNPAGSALVYSTYLGGALDDDARAVALDSSGHTFLAGSAGSHNFPTANPYQAALRGGTNAFITKLSSSSVAVPATGRHTVWLAALLLLVGVLSTASRRRFRSRAGLS